MHHVVAVFASDNASPDTIAVRKAGVKLHFGRPRISPAVKELIVLILPATLAAGVYQISQLF